eukprot:scaffold193_cov90-Cylindrotheca_fusiformis.AAC.2
MESNRGAKNGEDAIEKADDEHAEENLIADDEHKAFEEVRNADGEKEEVDKKRKDFWQAKCDELGELMYQMNQSSQSLTAMADIVQKSIVLAKLPYVIKTGLAENLERALEELKKNIPASSSPSNEELNIMPEPNDPSRLETALNDLNRLLRDIADNNDGSRLETEIGELNRLGFALNELSRRSAEQDKDPIYDSPESLPGWESFPLSIKLILVKERAEKLKSEARVMKERAEKLKSEARVMKERAEKLKERAEKLKSEAEKNAQTHLYNLTEHVRRITSSMGVAHQALKAMSGLSQAEGTFNTFGSDTKAAIEAPAMNRKRKLKDSGKEETAYKETPPAPTLTDDYKPILAEAKLLEHLHEPPLPAWNWGSDDRLGIVAEVLSHVYENGTFLNPRKSKPGKEIHYKKNVASSLEKLKKVLELLRGPLPERAEIDKQLKSLRKLKVPGAYAYETVGTQPWLARFFDAIAGTIIPSFSEIKNSDAGTPVVVGGSPVKNRLRQEVVIEGFGRRRNRRMDVGFNKDRQFQFMRDHIPDVGGEFKSGCRSNVGPITLLNEALDQILATMSKIVTVGFHFAGAGVPSHATAFIANMALIQIFHLRLQDVGTSDATVVLYKSHRYPLMCKKHFVRWVASIGETKMTVKIKEEFATLELELFPGESTGLDGSSIPKGFHILKSVLHCRHKDLFGPDIETTATDILGDLIGSGMQSHVFLHRNDDKKVVKVSKNESDNGLFWEATILRELSKNPSSCENIPIVDDQFLSPETGLGMSVGGVEKPFPALVISPRGIPSLVATAMCENKKELLEVVCDGISAALDFIHESGGVCHLDVNPNNIVVVLDDQKQPVKAVLIDFAMAEKRGAELIGFLGTPNYTHRAIFLKYPANVWSPKPEYDKAGLGFSLSVLANGGVRPWDSFTRLPRKLEGTERDGIFNERLDKARQVVNGSVFDDERKKKVISLINCDAPKKRGWC